MDSSEAPLTRRQRWERATNLPLMALAVVFLVLYAWRVLDTDVSPHLDAALVWADIAIWAIFAVDFAVRLRLSTDRLRFVRKHPLDLLVVLVPPFRPLRLVRAALLLLDSLNRATKPRTRLVTFVATSSLLILLLSSLAFFDAEYGAPESKIKTFGDALWWSAVSVTTVGYGDVYPVTTEGRLVSLVLMTLGIGLISFAIGTMTSWVVEQLKTVDDAADRAERTLTELVDEVRSLRAEVAELRTRAQEPPG
ncbi:ion transporter [Nocardia neocaledoniensis NBRC 108232]|uniref:Voltage-gated potassium channel n=1 Tax=Nocardia neocaledoniensis TaxID=236511 RepID=A0A317NQN2_9NOCA|nr:potassium channel family protein [Nocardia neocaledoniensis]PWV77661.1 voltage-gated potassium channel [Nocardia neocaledoniensis]GEM32065.1 ion transporter [Nocardia neocaledoniensis NBRC 108232]